MRKWKKVREKERLRLNLANTVTLSILNYLNGVKADSNKIIQVGLLYDSGNLF